MDKFDSYLRNENMWFKAAVCAAVLVFATVVIGTLVSLGSATDAEHRGQLIDVVYKLGLIGAGLITFCTVAWRGLIATQQAELQRQQIDKLSQQIAATEENNLATLLQKGAELIDEDDKHGHVMAGIATLQSVITAPNDKFAIEAMNLLADYLQTRFEGSHSGMRCAAAVLALRAGAELGRYCERSLKFEYPNSTIDYETASPWLPVKGVKFVRYESGVADPDIMFNESSGSTRYNFEKVEFFSGEVPDLTSAFHKCTFDFVVFSKVRKGLKGHSFKSCDFSGCRFEGGYDLGDLRSGKNYFDPENPPLADNVPEWDWDKYLKPASAADIPF
jgi:hypothetical protein